LRLGGLILRPLPGGAVPRRRLMLSAAPTGHTLRPGLVPTPAIGAGTTPRPAAYPHPHLMLALIGAAVVVGLFVAWRFTIDDAFITFRYAQHLAHGQGLTWNPGQRVEGYTDFLWVMLLAGAATLGWPLPTIAKILGAGSLVALVALLLLFGRHHGGRLLRWWPAGCLLLTPATYYHAVSGLETLLYALLVFGLFLSVLRMADHAATPSPGLAATLPFLGLAAGLTRPEGVLPAALAVIGACCVAPGGVRRVLVVATASALALGAAYFAWRWSYFGWLLPNTFYAKVDGHGAGVVTMVGLLRTYLPFLLVILLGWAAAPRSPVFRWGLAFLAAVVLPYAAFRPIMDFSGRFTYQSIPLLAAMSAVALGGLARRGVFDHVWRAIPVGLLLAITLATANYLPTDYGYHLRHGHVALGKALAAAPVPVAWRSLAVGDAGAIPYYSRWRAVDWAGLNDPAIAHGLPATRRILQESPTLVFVFSRDGVRPWDLPQPDVPTLLQRYEVGGAVEFHPHYYLLGLILRSAPPDVRQTLTATLSRVGATSAASNSGAGAAPWREMVASLPRW